MEKITGRLGQSARRAGVTAYDGGSNVVIECNECGYSWMPMLRSGGHFYRGWRKCPNGCNADKLSN